jgi:GntR family transcriptional regulator
MFTLDLQSRKAMSEQVFDNLRELIVKGVLKPGDKLPSVRELAESLTVAPNTVLKAFRALEEKGYVYSSPGLGTFAAPTERRRDNGAVRPQGETTPGAAEARFTAAVLELERLGRTKAQILELLNQSYREVTGGHD